MQRVHFIAIGGAAMHNLAIAISKKSSFLVTGSDDEILEPSFSRLKEHKLLPDSMGWDAERIHKGLSAVILGKYVKNDNSELIRAKELGLKVYSYPEYIFQQTRSKTRIVIAGSHGKTSITAMILYVLKNLKISADYMLSSQIDGYSTMFKLSYENRIAVIEGNESMTSSLDHRPEFLNYKPHIAVITGISWDLVNEFPTFVTYVEQFKKFVELMEIQGRLIYFDGDSQLNKISKGLRRDIVPFHYHTPKHIVRDGITSLIAKKDEVPLKIFGDYNLQNIEAARLACKQIGVTDVQFYSIITKFPGISNRMQKICETEQAIVFKDSAHSPSKLRASVAAVKRQYPNRKLTTCIELETFTNLTEEFLPQYKDCLLDADSAYVYFNPYVIQHKGLKEVHPNNVKDGFGGTNVVVFNDANQLKTRLEEQNFDNSVVLLITSSNFSGININELICRRIHD